MVGPSALEIIEYRRVLLIEILQRLLDLAGRTYVTTCGDRCHLIHVGKWNRIARILPPPILPNQSLTMPDFSELVIMCELAPKILGQWRLRSAFALFLNLANGSLHVADRLNDKQPVATDRDLELISPGNVRR